MRRNTILHVRNVAHMNDGCCHVHFVERQVLAFLFPQNGDTTPLLKIPSPSLVAFPKLLGISRIQWHSSGEQLACRNSLLKGAGSGESRRGCSLCAWAGMELSLGMSWGFFRCPCRPSADIILIVLTACRWQLSLTSALSKVASSNVCFHRLCQS